jgi:hypothetical protein
MKFLNEMGTAYAKSPTSPAFYEPFVRLYLAFRPATVAQAKTRKWGLLYEVERPGLATHSAVVKSAWDVAFPVLKPFLEGKPTPPGAAQLKAVADWLAKNPPASRTLVPNGKEYPAK